METYRVRRIDREGFDWHDIRASDPGFAALSLVEQYEAGAADFDVASGNEEAVVEVEDYGKYRVRGEPWPHYNSTRVDCTTTPGCEKPDGHPGDCSPDVIPF